MARGVKMTVARHAGKCICASNVKDSDKVSLICRYCNASVVHVKGYKKNASKHYIPTHFRLGQNEKHELYCDYIIENYIKNICNSQSKSVKNGEKIFPKNKNGVFYLRLNFPDKSSKTKKSLHDNINDRTRSTDESNAKKGISYTNRDHEISPYFRTAMNVVRIKKLLDVNKLHNLIIIKYKNREIYWADFLFDKSGYLDLYRKISNGARIEHPVSLLVMPEYKQGRKSIKCCRGGDGTNHVVPYLDFDNSEFIQSIELKERYIVLVNCLKEWNPTNLRIDPRLYITISHRDQIAKL